MARVAFAAHLRQIGPPEPLEFEGANVGAVLTSVFGQFPVLKSYIYDDQDRVRKHIAIFVDGVRLDNQHALTETVGAATEIHVLQALSGG